MTTLDSPWIKTVALNPPSLQNNTADADRLIAALKEDLQTDNIEMDLELLKSLPELLRNYKYHIRCMVFKDRSRWILTGITDAGDTAPTAGLAVDLGTTRVVLRLIDLNSFSTLAESAFDNPQDDHSWEDMDGNTTVITRAADLAVARGIVVVNGVGNDGLLTEPNTLYAPADGDSVIAVGAVTSTGARSAISSYGPTADGRTKPDVLAQGIGTFMAQSTTPIAYGAGSGTPVLGLSVRSVSPSTAGLVLSGASPGGAGILCVSTCSASSPVPLYTVLVDLGPAHLVGLLPVNFDPSGRFELPVPVQPAVPVFLGTSLFFQGAQLFPTVGLSNGLGIVLPP